MTLTTRLTVVIACWVAVILIIVNAVAMVWFRAHALLTVQRTAGTELAEVTRLANSIPHLELMNDRWEASALVEPSMIRFIDGSGHVTSQAVSPGFPIAAASAAENMWGPTIRAQLKNFKAQLPDKSALLKQHIERPLTPPGPIAISTTEFSRWLPAYRWTDARQQRGLIALMEPTIYPDGQIGRVEVVATLDNMIQNYHAFLTTLLVADALGLLLLSVGTYLIASQGLKPISGLIDGIRQVEWSLKRRVHVHSRSPQEIKSLAESVNHLLEQVDRAIQDQHRFVADASHELRTPLAIVAGHANLLRRWGKTHEEVWEPAVHHIVTEVGRLQNLVDHLLLLSKLDSGYATLGEPLEAGEIRHLISQLREDGQLLRPDLSWATAVHVPHHVTVQMNANILRQILVIIVDNAIAHTSAGAVEMMVNADEGMLRFHVTDTGDGIPEEDLPHIFDRFYRAEASRSRKAGGVGLGLSICRELVETHQGRISIDSTVGKGTTVTFTIPIVETSTRGAS